MATLLSILKPLIPMLFKKANRSGALLILIAVLFWAFMVSYVDGRHAQVQTEMKEMEKNLKGDSTAIMQEVRDVRQEVRDMHSSVLQLYRDVTIHRRHR